MSTTVRRMFNRRTILRVLLAFSMVWLVGRTVLSTDNLLAADGGDSRDIVVVVHGLGRSKVAMWLLASRLESAGYRVARVGYRSLQNTPEQILDDISNQIAECCIGKSPKLHFVGHSLGGLLIRAYLTTNDIANLGNVVLIGTPNAGTEIVDNLRHNWWFKVLGPMANALGTDAASFPNSIGPPDYPVGVIAGKRGGTANDKLLPGEDDGLVSIESTKIDGMADFVVVETGHSSMRYDKGVFHHTLAFLKNSHFAQP